MQNVYMASKNEGTHLWNKNPLRAMRLRDTHVNSLVPRNCLVWDSSLLLLSGKRPKVRSPLDSHPSARVSPMTQSPAKRFGDLPKIIPAFSGAEMGFREQLSPF